MEVQQVLDRGDAAEAIGGTDRQVQHAQWIRQQRRIDLVDTAARHDGGQNSHLLSWVNARPLYCRPPPKSTLPGLLLHRSLDSSTNCQSIVFWSSNNPLSHWIESETRFEPSGVPFTSTWTPTSTEARRNGAKTAIRSA